ncbi:MAG: redoxin domain-containing protein, partial [Rhodospirillales bacterium]|nr:redoxin domain-containing protein [Rhodospirillales bacterium]
MTPGDLRQTRGRVRAPEIDLPGLVWFNTPGPLSLAALRGKLVILDFWTFCCINCMHILPSLRRVEEAFPETVAVIGVHSPKFAAEKSPDNVAAAIARYGIVHPIVHDPEFRIWRSYAVRAWPTLMFVGPDGYVMGSHSGEPDPAQLLEAVREAVGEFGRHDLIRPSPLPLASVEPAAGRFRFPGKIKKLPGAGWVLADAG